MPPRRRLCPCRRRRRPTGPYQRCERPIRLCCCRGRRDSRCRPLRHRRRRHRRYHRAHPAPCRRAVPPPDLGRRNRRCRCGSQWRRRRVRRRRRRRPMRTRLTTPPLPPFLSPHLPGGGRQLRLGQQIRRVHAIRDHRRDAHAHPRHENIYRYPPSAIGRRPAGGVPLVHIAPGRSGGRRLVLPPPHPPITPAATTNRAWPTYTTTGTISGDAATWINARETRYAPPRRCRCGGCCCGSRLAPPLHSGGGGARDCTAAAPWSRADERATDETPARKAE